MGKFSDAFAEIDPSLRFNTNLSPQDEDAFNQWAIANNRQRDSFDYDMRGAWKAGIGQAGNGHFPDTYKKPNHPTFSNQSIYDGQGISGGEWSQQSGKDVYTPSADMVRQPGYVTYMLEKYMPIVEPGALFNMDKRAETKLGAAFAGVVP